MTPSINCYLARSNSNLDNDDEECSIFNGEDLLMLRFSNTKSSMLYKLVSVGKADWIVFNSLSAKSVLAGDKLVATYSISL